MSSDAIDRSGPADEDDRHAALALMLHGPRDHGHVSMADKATATYLNDHLAAASFAVDLVVRLREWAAGTEYDDVLLELAGEFEADRGTLVAVMARLGVAVSPAKQATSWIGRRLSRAKLSGFGPADAPTALLEALETLASGVDGKACLWRTLRDVCVHDPALDAEQLDALISRADGQRERLEDARRTAALRALREHVPGG